MTEHPVDPPDSRPPTNVRGHRQRTERNLVVGGFLILFVVGGGVVWYLYGLRAAVLSWICLGSGTALFALLYLLLKLLELVGTRR